MLRFLITSTLLLFLVGCENEEQLKLIDSLKTENSELLSEIQALSGELDTLNASIAESQSTAALKKDLQGFLNRLEAPINRFRTGVSYRDFSGIYAQALEVINQFGRDDLASSFPEIQQQMQELKVDLETVSSMYSSKFDGYCIGGGVCNFISLTDETVTRYGFDETEKTEYGWYADSVIPSVFGSITSRSDAMWEEYKKIK